VVCKGTRVLDAQETTGILKGAVFFKFLDIIKISLDKEKAKSIVKMAEDREKQIKELDITKFSTIITENYYEIIKELMTAIFLLNGIKTIGKDAHKELIELALKNKILDDFEYSLVDDLRNRRNKSQYEGKQISVDYLESKNNNFDKIIIKLEKKVNEMSRIIH
jgi:hypothetical protein